MADSKIPDLTETTAPAGDDEIEISDTSQAAGLKSRRMSRNNFMKGRQTVVLPVGSVKPTATAPGALILRVEAPTNDVNYDAGALDNAADEHYYASFKFPLSWNAGIITYRVFWTTAATGTTGIAFSLKARAVGDNELIDGTWGSPVVVIDDAQTGAGKMLITPESGDLTIGNTPGVDKWIFFDLSRDISDANDDMAEDAEPIGIEIFFTTSKAEDL